MARNTSYEVTKRYIDKTYDMIGCQIDKDLVFKFKALCDKNKISYNSALREGIEAFLDETSATTRRGE